MMEEAEVEKVLVNKQSQIGDKRKYKWKEEILNSKQTFSKREEKTVKSQFTRL